MMMYTLTVLTVVSFLASVGHSLECVLCVASIGTNCSGDSIMCPEGSVCGYVHVYTETTEASLTKTTNVFTRSCIVEQQCNTNGSITFANGKVKTVISCCYMDNCDPPLLMFPDDNPEGNGKVCRSCSSANSDWCYTGDTIECTGNETMCLLQTTKLSGTVSLQKALRGCATRSICDHGSYKIDSGGTRLDLEFVCTDGASTLRQKSSVFGLLVLVLLNFFIRW